MGSRTRKRFEGTYNEDSQGHPSATQSFEVESIKSTSNWDEIVTQYLKIEAKDAAINDIFNCNLDWFEYELQSEAESIVIKEWKDGSWLMNVDVKNLSYNGKTKTLISKIRRVYMARQSVTEMYVDGFMDSLLHILCFDEFPCLLYPQYQYDAHIGIKNHIINAISDFSVVSESLKMLLVIEDKTLKNATYANNWKEDQVLGELFVAVHNLATSSHERPIVYPINIYAVRVIGTLFTFYKTIATLEYIKESAKKLPSKSKMVVQRYPHVGNELSGPNALDICKLDDRINILKCMCSIRQFIISDT